MKLIEHYEIVKEIGQGGMATVFSARDKRLDRMVALKVMHPHLRGSSEARARFLREAKAVARLEHPSVLRIYEYGGEDSEACFIATELLTGPTLKQFVQSQRDIPSEVVAAIGVLVAEALCAAHAQGVIHRDVKPENLLFHEGRMLKLTDFGIAQLLDGQTMTVTGQILGSPGHMAPEQVTSGEVDTRTDVFSLGTTLYYVAVGELPFVGKNPHQILRNLVEGHYEPLQHRRPQVGSELADIVARCLKRDKEDRYPDAASLAADLRKYLADRLIHDATELLTRYLADPEGVRAALELQASTRLVQLARDAIAHGAESRALGLLNHALAIDENNVAALELIRTIGHGRTRHWRRPRVWVGVGVIALAAIALTVLTVGTRRPRDRAVALRAGDARQPSPTKLSRAPQAPSVSGDASVAQPVAPSLVDAGLNGSKRMSGPRASAFDRDSAPPPARPGLRRVVLQPFPSNVQIRVDNMEFRPFGPSFREIDLAPGTHRFFVAGAYNCCRDREFVRDIPAGRGAYELSLRLELRPATLYVQANVPANVVVGDKLARGRTRALLEVPMSQDPSRVYTVRVEAPGYDTYTEQVRFQAGQIKEIRVALRESKKSSSAQSRVRLAVDVIYVWGTRWS
jgi:tRNA A-37 threonylcarbamoyl transferase component Bud32